MTDEFDNLIDEQIVNMLVHSDPESPLINEAAKRMGCLISKMRRMCSQPLPPAAYDFTVQPYVSALRMIREAVGELFGPVASMESEEAVLLSGPEPHHDAEAIIAALQRVAKSLRRLFHEGVDGQRIGWAS